MACKRLRNSAFQEREFRSQNPGAGSQKLLLGILSGQYSVGGTGAQELELGFRNLKSGS
jgi:hypothetical protein